MSWRHLSCRTGRSPASWRPARRPPAQRLWASAEPAAPSAQTPARGSSRRPRDAARSPSARPLQATGQPGGADWSRLAGPGHAAGPSQRWRRGFGRSRHESDFMLDPQVLFKFLMRNRCYQTARVTPSGSSADSRQIATRSHLDVGPGREPPGGGAAEGHRCLADRTVSVRVSRGRWLLAPRVTPDDVPLATHQPTRSSLRGTDVLAALRTWPCGDPEPGPSPRRAACVLPAVGQLWHAVARPATCRGAGPGRVHGRRRRRPVLPGGV